MAVILGERSDAREAIQFAGFFVAVEHREVGITQRQVAVAPRLACIDLRVLGAIHGFQKDSSSE